MSKSRTNHLFLAFVRANDLIITPDFRRQTKVYSGLGIDRTEKEMRESVEFSGFVDGYEGHGHRYDGAKGKLKKEAPASLLEGVLNEFMGSGDPHVQEVLGMVEERTGGLFNQGIGLSPRELYSEQYTLGSSSPKDLTKHL
jgi:hypothetical protein